MASASVMTVYAALQNAAERMIAVSVQPVEATSVLTLVSVVRTMNVPQASPARDVSVSLFPSVPQMMSVASARSVKAAHVNPLVSVRPTAIAPQAHVVKDVSAQRFQSVL